MTSRPLRRMQRFALPLLAAWMASAGAAPAQETRVDCVVEPAQKLKIGSATPGILKNVPVNRGTTVEAGDVIARLDASVEEANVALSRAQAESVATIEAQQTRVELYKRRLDRQSQLSKGIVTQERLDQVEADYEIGRRDLQTEILKRKLAGIELSRAEAQLELRMIRSPIRGIVTERLMSAGEFVRQDSAIFTLVQLDPLYVEAYLPVSRWKEISLGMATTVELDQPIGGTYQAKVTVVDHVFDAASGTFGVRLELPNPDFKLPGGQRCKVGFPLAQKGPLATATPPGGR